MSDEEMWDLVTRDGAPMGRTHRRGDAVWSDAAFHVVVGVCVVRPDGRVLMTRRAAVKDYPLTWEFPAGSVLAGETSAHGAARELQEETGVTVSAASLVLVRRFAEPTALFDLYAARITETPPLRPDPLEVAEAEWVPVDVAEQRYRSGAMATPWTPRLDAMWGDLFALISAPA
jgi:mutator protein MutT